MVGRIAMKTNLGGDSDSRKKIIDAAIELFYEQGYEKTTTREIVHRAGVFNGSLYYFFTNKEDIFKAVIVEAFEVSLTECEKIIEESKDYIIALSFPLGLELYTASRSKNAGMLLYHAHQSWPILDEFVKLAMDWIIDHIPEIKDKISEKTFYHNILTVMGAVGNLVGEFANENGTADYKEGLKTTIKIISAIFEYPIFNINAIVDNVSELIENENVIIGNHFGRSSVSQ